MRLEGVGFRYSGSAPWVLRHVTLDLAAGEVVEVTGRNGTGKSTLLKLVAGVLQPGAGAVIGRPAVVGWVPEQFPTAQPHTAEGYLLAQAAVRGLSPVEARHAVDRESERLGLADFVRTPLTALSKGSAQKVGIAQAVLVRPGLLILDEPWTGLDVQSREAMPALVSDVARAGGCVLVSDHHRRSVALPLTGRWHVAGGTAVAAAPDAEPPDQSADGRGDPPRAATPGAGPGGLALLEVDDADVDTALALLAARGIGVRLHRRDVT
jgi:ABC-type Mn2+/Zn2+ transport system ATPase subunit